MRMIGLVRLGADPELRYTQAGDPVLGFPAAWNYGRKGEDGNKPTQWCKLSLWGARAEKLEPHLKKGQLVMVVLVDAHVETYEKRDGGQGTQLVARIEDLEFTGKAEGGDQPASAPARPAHRPSQQQAPADDGFDDDIPF